MIPAKRLLDFLGLDVIGINFLIYELLLGIYTVHLVESSSSGFKSYNPVKLNLNVTV